METLIKRILKNIQGDKSANAGERGEAPNESETEDEDMDVIDGFEQSWYEIGRGMETAKGSELDLGAAWKELKEWVEHLPVLTLDTLPRPRYSGTVLALPRLEIHG